MIKNHSNLYVVYRELTREGELRFNDDTGSCSEYKNVSVADLAACRLTLNSLIDSILLILDTIEMSNEEQ